METELANQVGIEEIKDDTAVLKDGSMVAVLEIAPIDFDSLSGQRKKKVTKAYLEWLEKTDYPVQISARTLNADIAEQAKVLKDRVEYAIKQKEEHRDLLKEYKQFEEWLDNYLKANAKKCTVYYLAIPYFPAERKKGIFSRLSKSKAREEYSKSLEMLNKRVSESTALLSKTGVRIQRLSPAQLRSLYSSYFTVTNRTGAEYLPPELWFDSFKNAAGKVARK